MDIGTLVNNVSDSIQQIKGLPTNQQAREIEETRKYWEEFMTRYRVEKGLYESIIAFYDSEITKQFGEYRPLNRDLRGKQ